MDSTTEEYYREVTDTVNSLGWKFLCEDFENAVAELDSLAGIKTLEQLHFNRGRVDTLRSFITMAEQVAAMMEADDDA